MSFLRLAFGLLPQDVNEAARAAISAIAAKVNFFISFFVLLFFVLAIFFLGSVDLLAFLDLLDYLESLAFLDFTSPQ
jgi:hypothetical protein